MKKIFFLLLSAVSLITAVAQPGTKNIVTDKMSGSDCNNVVEHDKFAGAQDRSPSECEVQFYAKVRSALQDGFGKVIRNWPGKDWVLNSDTIVKPLNEIGRQTEKYFFMLPGSFHIDMSMNPASGLYKSWYEKYEASMTEMKSLPGEASYKKFTDFNYNMNGALHINIYVSINNMTNSIYFFKGGSRSFNVPGAAYAVKGSHASALTGGGDENSKDACLIIIGKPKTTVRKNSDASETIEVQNTFSKASHITTQEITIRIECNDEILNKLLKEIDFTVLNNLIGK